MPRLITIADDVASFAEAAANTFVVEARHAIARRGKFVVALTGGSTPGPIHRLLAQSPFRDDVAWDRVVVLFGDERAVPKTDKSSNYKAAHEDLLKHVPQATVHAMDGDTQDLDAAARAYEATLKSVGPIDLLFVGLGKDAHVLSLYPGSPAIDEKDRLVVAELNPPMDPPLSRITMTPPVVEQSRVVLAIATGEGKRDAVRRLLHGDDDAKQTPAHLLRRAKDLRLMIDRAAYEK